MTEAILYIAHGTRIRAGNEQARLFVDEVKAKVAAPIQEMSYLELAEPTIAEGIARCVEQGATHITIAPILLFAAGHAKKDIPEEIEAVRDLYPHVTFTSLAPFGVEPRIVPLLVNKLNVFTGRTAVIFVGRGSYDEEALAEYEQLRQAIASHVEFPVYEAFLAVAEPHFTEQLSHVLAQDYEQVVILPYLLFQGRLMNELKRAEKQDERVVCLSSLYPDDVFVNIMAERLSEVTV